MKSIIDLSMKLDVGDQAPGFMLMDQNEDTVALDDLLGKWVVIYFYPKDDTPGCTTEGIEFTMAKEDFAIHDTVIVGISPDSCQSHYKFVCKHTLDITLLSDENEKTIEAYGVRGEKNMYGKKVMGVIRSTFLLNPEGKVMAVWSPVNVKGHVQEVLKKLEELRG